MDDFILPQKHEAFLFDDVQYSIPGLFLFSKLIFNLDEIIYNKFSKSLPIKYLYGAPVCAWNGGRLLFNVTKQSFEKQSIFEELHLCIAHGFSPLITFSNMKVEEKDLSDELCNFILKTVNKIGGEIIVASEILKKYIHEKYPNIKLHASVLLTAYNRRDIEFYKKLSEEYSCYVVHPDDNFNFDLLDNIPKNNAEILVNERCGFNCKIRKNHYESIAKDQIDFVKGNYKNQNFLNSCKFMPEIKQSDTKLRNIALSIREVDVLVNKGFKLLKIQGRVDNYYSFFFDLLRYTLEPEIAFPTIFPIFAHVINNYLGEING